MDRFLKIKHTLDSGWHKMWWAISKWAERKARSHGWDEAYETLHCKGYRGSKGHVEEKCGQFVWKEDTPEIMLDDFKKKE
jgi:hypothetical protein